MAKIYKDDRLYNLPIPLTPKDPEYPETRADAVGRRIRLKMIGIILVKLLLARVFRLR